jgi:hypothetical protein
LIFLSYDKNSYVAARKLMAKDKPNSKHWRERVGTERLKNKAFTNRDDVILWDIFEVEDGEELRLTFESKESEWMQGVWLMCNNGISVNDELQPSVYFWYFDPSVSWDFTCHTSNGYLSIYNAWDRGLGPNSQSHSSGMLVEDLPNGKRYHCNDIGFDTEFDKVVFRIERLT